MNRYSFILWQILLFVFLLGCGKEPSADGTGLPLSPHDTVNNFTGMTMMVKEDTISPSALTIIFENQTDREVQYGDEYFLEVKIVNKWYQLPVQRDDYGFDAIAYLLPPGDRDEMKIDWESIYGELPKGKYRVVKSIHDSRGMGDFDEYFLSVSFTID